MHRDSHEYKLACKMFDILAKRATTVDGPRINTKKFSNRLGLKWEHIEPILVLIEWYCYEKNIRSLSALVVLPNNNDISFPGEWFGEYIPDIINGKIPEWKLPLTPHQKNWHYQYWRDLRTEWKTINFDEQTRDFGERLASVDWFKWPSTLAPIGTGEIKHVVMPRVGLFSHVGYRVGKNGQPSDDRQENLSWIFENELPSVNSNEYMDEFGQPKTPKRLQKMANFLAAQARNYARKKISDYSIAIHHYKVDLQYLYEKYYVDFFGFDDVSKREFEWPDFPCIDAEIQSFLKSEGWEVDSAESDPVPAPSESTPELESEVATDTEPKPRPPNQVHPPMEKEEVGEPTDSGEYITDGETLKSQSKPKTARTKKIVIAVTIVVIVVAVFMML